jgi:AcrR family transcriptional regulator
MTTKEKILATALKLLNKNGFKSVTIRHVAKEMGISHGNLGYHYPNMEVIVHELYLALVNKMNAEINSLKNPAINLKLIFETNIIVFNNFYDYRFLFLDFVEICRSIPSVKEHYQKLVQKRESEFLHILAVMQNEKIIDSRFTKEQLSQFVKTLFISADFWLSSSEIIYHGKEKDKVNYYLHLFFSQLYPYLSKKGEKDYLELVKEYKYSL